MSTSTSDNDINTVNICVKKKNGFKYRDTFFKVKDNVVDNEDGNNNDKDERVDAFGNPIRKGKRKHKVSFSDEVSKGKLVDVIELCKTYKTSNKNKYCDNNNNTSSKRNVSLQRNERKDNQKENVKCESCVLY